jgi:hypothetical protein
MQNNWRSFETVLPGVNWLHRNLLKAVEPLSVILQVAVRWLDFLPIDTHQQNP